VPNLRGLPIQLQRQQNWIDSVTRSTVGSVAIIQALGSDRNNADFYFVRRLLSDGGVALFDDCSNLHVRKH
jgi:hypothetical protein